VSPPVSRMAGSWALAGAALLGALALGGGFLVEISGLAGQARALRLGVLAEGSALRARLEPTAFFPPSSASLELGPVRGESGLTLDRAALSFSGRTVWSVPPGPLPGLDRPASGTEEVRRDGGAWVYLYAVPDGRTLTAVFHAPGYEQARRQILAMAALQAGAGLALAVLALLLLLRLSRGPREEEPAAAALRNAAGPSEGGQSVPAVAALFQQSLKELRQRAQDLEELHRKERLRAEDVESMVEALCANLEAGYLRIDQRGLVSGVNPAARGLLGLKDLPRIGGEARQLLSGQPGIIRALEEAQASRNLVLLDEVPGAGGLLLQVVAIPLFNLLSQPRGLLLLLRDLTGVYRMRQTLREREALSRLGEVAAGVAHEVRNALNTFSARLRLLRQDVPQLADNPHFQALADESAGLERAMQDLLFFARPLPLEKGPLPLRPFLLATVAGLSPALADIETEVVCDEGIALSGDSEALGRALGNLLRNAAEVLGREAGGRGRVRVSASRLEEWVHIDVEDDGPGVSEGLQSQLFSPFFTQKPGGTGLGLAIARKVAREHGGDLVYFPSQLGGAGFRLRLPSDPRGGSTSA
jgi:two-component system sensor histidine kinase FlrB